MCIYVYMYVFICLFVGICLYICRYKWRHVIACIYAYVYTHKCNDSSVTIHAEYWGRATLLKGLKVHLCLIPFVWT